MTNEELFKKVKTHLLTQKRRSVDPEDEYMCLYRGPGGLKCAVGALIKDEEYDPSMEGFPVMDPRVKLAVENSLGEKLTEENMELLQSLQALHDQYLPFRWPILLESMEKFNGCWPASDIGDIEEE